MLYFCVKVSFSGLKTCLHAPSLGRRRTAGEKTHLKCLPHLRDVSLAGCGPSPAPPSARPGPPPPTTSSPSPRFLLSSFIPFPVSSPSSPSAASPAQVPTQEKGRAGQGGEGPRPRRWEVGSPQPFSVMCAHTSTQLSLRSPVSSREGSLHFSNENLRTEAAQAQPWS